MKDFPDEVLLNIFSKSEVRDLSNIALVNKRWHNLCKHDYVWKIKLGTDYGDSNHSYYQHYIDKQKDIYKLTRRYAGHPQWTEYASGKLEAIKIIVEWLMSYPYHLDPSLFKSLLLKRYEDDSTLDKFIHDLLIYGVKDMTEHTDYLNTFFEILPDYLKMVKAVNDNVTFYNISDHNSFTLERIKLRRNFKLPHLPIGASHSSYDDRLKDC